MATSSSTLTQVGGRYASALFDLAKERGELDAVAADIDRLSGLIAESADLRRFLKSPLYKRAEQAQALSALFAKAGFSGLVANFVLLIARNGRLFTLDAAIAAFHDLLAAERGEVTVGVVSAEPLSDEQSDRLKAELSKRLGASVRIDGRVDQSLLGGLVVRIGSHQFDGSLKTKLDRLAVAMKGNA